MKVKDILRNCAIVLDDTELLKCIDENTFSEQDKQTRDMLLECCNLVNIRIASEYIVLKDVVEISCKNGKISIYEISDKKVYDILSVKNNGYPVQFVIRNGYLVTGYENVSVEYSFLPQKLNIDDDINCYLGKVNERVFAYGAVSEYLAIKGNIDDSNYWNTKFVSALSRSYTKHREIIMPNRRWR